MGTLFNQRPRDGFFVDPQHDEQMGGFGELFAEIIEIYKEDKTEG